VKSVKVRPEETFLNEIFKTLKSVPKRRLRIVRDVVGALAEPAISNKGKKTLKRTTEKSLLKTPFCGMWKRRTDITNGQSHARTLRRRLETRGDRV
jgi:hypothetical protein